MIVGKQKKLKKKMPPFPQHLQEKTSSYHTAVAKTIFHSMEQSCCFLFEVLQSRKLIKVMPSRCVNPLILFMGRLRPPKLLINTKSI